MNDDNDYYGVNNFNSAYAQQERNRANIAHNDAMNAMRKAGQLELEVDEANRKIKELAVYHAGNGNINIPNMLNKIEISIPPLKVQEEIIKKIEQLESETSHYTTYAKVLQTELDSNSKTIK